MVRNKRELRSLVSMVLGICMLCNLLGVHISAFAANDELVPARQIGASKAPVAWPLRFVGAESNLQSADEKAMYKLLEQKFAQVANGSGTVKTDSTMFRLSYEDLQALGWTTPNSNTVPVDNWSDEFDALTDHVDSTLLASGDNRHSGSGENRQF